MGALPFRGSCCESPGQGSEVETAEPAKSGRGEANRIFAGWPSTRSNECWESLLAAHAARTGAGTPGGKESWCGSCPDERSLSSETLRRGRRRQTDGGWKWRPDGCVTGQVLQNVFRTGERRLGVNHPLLPGDGFEKRCEVLFAGERRALPKKASLWLRNACRKPSVNLRRKTRLSTFTGKKKRGPEPIQRV